MKPDRIKQGDTIGIFSPSHVAEVARYEKIRDNIERMGFKVKFGKNIFNDTYEYAASAEERADDLNSLVSDDEVKMVLFCGGDGAVEILPYIDYENVRRHPKIFSSFSDATSILNAIHSQIGLTTYYGFGAGQFEDLRYYDYRQFSSHFLAGEKSEDFFTDGKWITLNGGKAQGVLIGGYALLFGLMLTNKYFKFDSDTEYILILEDYERYSPVGGVASYIAFIEQSPFMKNVSALIFGHYSTTMPQSLLNCLERFGRRNNIPVIYTDDFGHGSKHAIFPIGSFAKLDADKQTLVFDAPAE